MGSQLSTGGKVVPSRSGSYSRVRLVDQCQVLFCQRTGGWARPKLVPEGELDTRVDVEELNLL